jgi:hypothetical protein
MLTAEVMWARIQRGAAAVHEELTVSATSMAGENVDCHSQWPRIELQTGDEVLIRVVDAENFDEPESSGTLENLRPDGGALDL